MPIYAYKCGACGHAQDVLQKMSDAPLSTCPSCGSNSYAKQVTAAGFQLKGSGWYVTDFRNGSGGAASSGATAAATTSAATSTSTAAEPAASSTSSSASSSTSASST